MSNGKSIQRAEVIRQRLGIIAQRYTQSEIARRTSTPITSVHRYLRKRRVPSNFCASLVKDLGVNPIWLLTGEGKPWLAEVRAETGQMAGGLLELVGAMNSIERARLGSLAGANTVTTLRDLSRTITSYEATSQRINRQSVPVLRQVLKEWDLAIEKQSKSEADSLAAAAHQIWQLCTDRELSREYFSVCSRHQFLNKNVALGFSLARKALLMSLTSHTGIEGVINEAHRFSVAVSYEDHLREARQYAQAVLLLAMEEAKRWPRYWRLEGFHGFVHIREGKIRRGVEILRRCLPRIENDRHDLIYATMIEGLLVLGSISLQSVIAMSADTTLAELGLRGAAYVLDPAAIGAAIRAYTKAAGGHVPSEYYWTTYCQYLLDALNGDIERALTRYLEFVALLERGMHPHPMARPTVAVDCATLLRAGGRRDDAIRETLNCDRAISEMPSNLTFSLFRRAAHYRNVLSLLGNGSGASSTNDIVKRAQSFFARQAALGHSWLVPVALNEKVIHVGRQT